MKVYNENPGKGAYQLMDPCPVCKKPVTSFEWQAYDSADPKFKFFPCKDFATDIMCKDWRVYRYATAERYNKEVIRRYAEEHSSSAKKSGKRS